MLTLKKGSLVAGAYFADDQIIWDVVLCDGETPPRFTQDKTARKFELDGHSDTATIKLTFEECLTASLERIALAMPKGASLDALCVAMPGPMVGSGVRSSRERADKPAQTTAHHRMGWNKKEINETLRASIQKLGVQHIIDFDVPFVVHTDAAAYCMGDYHIETHGRPVEKRPEVFCHIVVDEGVSGAFVVRDKLLDTGHHAEIGHLPIRQHEDDLGFEPHCNAHNFRGCAESYISLPALRRRWGDDVHIALPHWTDKDRQPHLIAYYLAQMCVSLILTVNVDAIRFSGRVSSNDYIFALASEYTKVLLQIPNIKEESFFPGYSLDKKLIGLRNDPDAGIYGCIMLAFEQMRAE